MRSITSFAQSATSFIADNIILCPTKLNYVDRKRSNAVLAIARKWCCVLRTQTQKRTIMMQVILVKHHLRRYDAFASQIWCCSFYSQWYDVCTKTLGEADIISEGNIISVSVIICQRQTSLKKPRSKERGFFWQVRTIMMQVILVKHRLRRYDVFHFVQNDVASFHSQWYDVCTKASGEADIISEGNIICVSVIICQRQTSLKKPRSKERGFFWRRHPDLNWG